MTRPITYPSLYKIAHNTQHDRATAHRLRKAPSREADECHRPRAQPWPRMWTSVTGSNVSLVCDSSWFSTIRPSKSAYVRHGNRQSITVGSRRHRGRGDKRDSDDAAQSENEASVCSVMLTRDAALGQSTTFDFAPEPSLTAAVRELLGRGLASATKSRRTRAAQLAPGTSVPLGATTRVGQPDSFVRYFSHVSSIRHILTFLKIRPCTVHVAAAGWENP
jgi:hypothetical protein